MDIGKEQIFEERRVVRSKEVRIQFVTPDYFNVLDEEGSLKYVGSIGKDLYCTCMSYMQHDKDFYSSTHSEVFRCKHIMAAQEILSR